VWFLIIRSSNEELQEYTLKSGLNSLGRNRENDIVLFDNAASGHHAEIFYDKPNDKISIHDLGSTNGTFVNGKRISTPQALQHEDQIRIGFCIISIIHSDPQSNLRGHAHHARTKITSELILESIDHYGVLLHDVGQRLVNVPDLNTALTEIAELIKRMIAPKNARSCWRINLTTLKKKESPPPWDAKSLKITPQ